MTSLIEQHLALNQMSGEGYRHDPAGAGVAPYGHGVGGVFAIPGTEDEVFSAMMLPTGGILDYIPVMDASMSSGGQFGIEDWIFESILTGVTAGAGDDYDNQPTTDCADGPVGGLKKVCTIVNTHGRYRHGVREVSLYRAGRRASKCDPLALRLMNAPSMQNLLGVPTPTASANNVLMNEFADRMWESAVSARRAFSKEVWTGNPANGSGEFRRLMGLNLHINTGTHIDYQASAVCTAADSDLKNFGYTIVDAAAGRSIVEYIEMADAFCDFNANRQGLSPVEGVIAMRPELWREVSSIWPVQRHQEALLEIARYANGRVMVDASSATNERDMLRSTKLLPVNGKIIPVVVDDGIFENDSTNNQNLAAGQYASDITFVPLRVMGGIPVTYFKMYNYDNGQVAPFVNLPGGAATFVTDGGFYRFYVNFKNGCINLTWEFSPRLHVRTSQLAWRIQNVGYEPLQHFRSFDPTSSYFADGGVTNQPTASYYAPWSPSTRIQL